METTVKQDGVEVTLRRRTNLSEAKKNAIVLKMATFYVELATEIDEEAQAVDAALSTYANISAQARGAVIGIELAKPSDTIEALILKSRQWLLDTNPDTSLKLATALDEVNATWHEPAMAAILPDDADPKV